MQVIYSNQPMPESFTKSIFLAGPTPREYFVESWRPEAIRLLEEAGYDGVVFSPEYPEGSKGEQDFDYEGQVGWEAEAMNMSDLILFWVPRVVETMPAFTTNHEHGEWFRSGKVMLGYPETASKMRYLDHKAKEEGVPVTNNLGELVALAVERLGKGCDRKKGERTVPLFIWNTPAFKSWYENLKIAGNVLEEATLKWAFRVGPNKGFVFAYALHVNIFVTKEGRNKTNEVILSRPNISSTVLYQKDKDDIMKSRIALVKEFRSTVNNTTGFVLECAGGSSFKETDDPRKVAAEEVFEEVGIRINHERVRIVGERQLLATFSTHTSTLFAIELTKEEMDALDADTEAHGDHITDSEMTYIEVRMLYQILSEGQVGWTDMGMILSVVYGGQGV